MAERVDDKSEVKEKKDHDRILGKLFASTGLRRERQPERATPNPAPAFNPYRAPIEPRSSSSSRIPAGIGAYILLMVASVLGLVVKNAWGYSPIGSLFITALLAIFFFVAVHFTPEPQLKTALVLLTTAFEIFAQYTLRFYPDSIREWVITFHVFAWVALAIILFLMGVFDSLGAGQELPWWAWLLTAAILGFFILYIVFPLVLQGPLANQDKSHAEYFGIAKDKLFSVAKSFQETTNSGTDFLVCSFSATSATMQYDTCLEEKKITRYCRYQLEKKSEAEENKEQKECEDEQRRLIEQGQRPGVAGSVSEAIKEVTKVEIKVDDYFPKKSTDVRKVYPVTLKIENPRKQVFTAQVNCVFKKGKEEFLGEIFIAGEKKSEVQVNGEHTTMLTSVGCQPTIDLNGKYTLEYSAVLSGMQTFSFLRRGFVRKEIAATIREQIETDDFKAKERASQGPAEFALLNFKFGTGEGTEPLVLIDEPVTFSFSVADVGGGDGEVLKVNSYDFEGLIYGGFGIDETKIGDTDCLQGGEIMLSSALTKKREPSELKRCFLLLPPDLKGLTGNDFEVETFVANMNYDYKLTKSIPNIEVTPLESPELVS